MGRVRSGGGSGCRHGGGGGDPVAVESGVGGWSRPQQTRCGVGRSLLTTWRS